MKVSEFLSTNFMFSETNEWKGWVKEWYITAVFVVEAMT